MAGVALLGTVGLLVLLLARGERIHPTALGLAFDVVIAGALAAPFAVRRLGSVVRTLLVGAGGVTAAAGVWLGALAIRPALATAEARLLLDAGAVAVLVLVLVPGLSALRAAVDRRLFRRTLDRRLALQRFVAELPPEAGAPECTRRALEELVRMMDLRGAAVLPDGGEPIAVGRCDADALARRWPHDGASLPERALVGLDLLALPRPLRQVLAESDVVGLVPVATPRRRCGVLVFSTGFLGATFTDEELYGVTAFAGQLALVLDAAALLDRAVAVERALAHAGRLATVGETAARIAHEIRNPVTAARSLAQQLAREPGDPFATEHALILGELERVERQVAALLRFARREQYALAAVDLGAVVRSAVDAFRARLAEAGVALAVEVADGVRVRADPEKLRQVVVNLVENALDALAGAGGGRRLSLRVAARNGTAMVEVADTGPGVPPEALPQLFEPFFSLKSGGTGLGLAIAKRTIDAHGGRIGATSVAGAGTTFRIDLPVLAGADDA
jgi:signal transduction histidine kinase